MSPSRSVDPARILGTGIERRTVLRASAWSVPVIALATATPAAAASTVAECDDNTPTVTALSWSSTGALASNWGNDTTTGWIGSYRGSPGGDATQNVTNLDDGFLSQDDNDSNTEVATVTMLAEVSVVDGASYSFNLDTAVGYGNPGGYDGSARQSLVLTLQQPDSSAQELLKLTVDHYDATTVTPSNADMTADGYIVQTPGTARSNALAFEASGTGTATLRFEFTIQPKIGENRTDDISVGIPSLFSQVCPA